MECVSAFCVIKVFGVDDHEATKLYNITAHLLHLPVWQLLKCYSSDSVSHSAAAALPDHIRGP